MRNRFILFIILITLSSTASAESKQSIKAFAKPALIGMQLSVSKAKEKGKVPPHVAECISMLDDSSFEVTIASLLEQNLNNNERNSTEHFFSSRAGRKYARYGLMQLYLAYNLPSPENVPEPSENEYREIETFKKTSAGIKLFSQKILENADAKQAIGKRIQELVKSCDTKEP